LATGHGGDATPLLDPLDLSARTGCVLKLAHDAGGIAVERPQKLMLKPRIVLPVGALHPVEGRKRVELLWVLFSDFEFPAVVDLDQTCRIRPPGEVKARNDVVTSHAGTLRLTTIAP